VIKGIKVLSGEDFELLYFLWKWKMATTAAIATSIYKHKTWYRSYVRLNDLAKAKYIRSISSDSGKAFIWTLDNKGFAIIQETLPQLSSIGYKSENQAHDFLVSAIHLGDWLVCPPTGCATFSEQELRRISRESYPVWVPITDTHRPDGYWKVAVGNSKQFKVVALEVELSLKAPSEYHETGEFYSNDHGIDQVIWVTKTISAAKYIHKHLQNGRNGQRTNHSFVTLDQYYEHQWQSKIIDGKDQGISLVNLLGNIGEIHPNRNLGVFLLDGRKSPKKSTSIEDIQKHNFIASRGYNDVEQ
jgi:hypothetical protein